MIGIQMYTLRNYMKTPEDLENTLARVHKMGYSSVQITPPDFTNAVNLAQQLKRHNLQADSAMCSVYEIPKSIADIVKNAKALGTDVLRTDSIRNQDRISVDGYHRFAEHLNTCGSLLAEQGLHFMYHFHSFEWIKLGDTRGVDILLQETNPKTVWFQPDVFWLTAAGCEPSEALKMFRGRARYMHMKDYIIVPNEAEILEVTTRASAPVGTGNLAWNNILKTAKEIGIENFVVEDDMGILDPFESAEISSANMRKFGL